MPLSADELGRLLAVAPVERSTCYRVATTTGLRRAELRKLEWPRVDLDGARILVRASTAKNRKEATLPLPPDTVEVLRQHRARRAGPSSAGSPR